MDYSSTQILSLVIVATSVKKSSAKSYKRVVIHVPVKVKHHHHTHTVYKHVHHAVPVHHDHHDIHVVHPETTEDIDSDYFAPHSQRGIEHIMEDIGSYSDFDYDRSGEQDSYERYRKKRSKNKFKLFNNKLIGWKGRSDFDKIASEYLQSIKRQRIPDRDYRELHHDYDDEDSKKKR